MPDTWFKTRVCSLIASDIRLKIDTSFNIAVGHALILYTALILTGGSGPRSRLLCPRTCPNSACPCGRTAIAFFPRGGAEALRTSAIEGTRFGAASTALSRRTGPEKKNLGTTRRCTRNVSPMCKHNIFNANFKNNLIFFIAGTYSYLTFLLFVFLLLLNLSDVPRQFNRSDRVG